MSRYVSEQIETIVIGGGQAGLAVGYHLTRAGLPFVVLDAHHRVGDSWRTRWDSLRLFTPASHDGLPGLRFPAPRTAYPTKDEMADYLEAYAARFELPVRLGVRVDALAKNDDGFVVASGDLRFEADNVVVATPTSARACRRSPASSIPSWSSCTPSTTAIPPSCRTDPSSSSAPATPAPTSPSRWCASTRPGCRGGIRSHPFPINRLTAGLVYPLVRFGFHRVLTVRSPIGRKFRAKLDGHGKPLVRVKPKDLAAAGVERVPRTVGGRDGLPLLEDGRVLGVANVIWCTGLRPDFSWIDIPVFDGPSQPAHERGIAASEPGLYFAGLEFLYSASSAQINGVGRDAKHVVRAIAAGSGAVAPRDSSPIRPTKQAPPATFSAESPEPRRIKQSEPPRPRNYVGAIPRRGSGTQPAPYPYEVVQRPRRRVPRNRAPCRRSRNPPVERGGVQVIHHPTLRKSAGSAVVDERRGDPPVRFLVEVGRLAHPRR